MTSIGPLLNPQTYTQTSTVVQGGWVDGPPLFYSFLNVAVFQKNFAFSGKPLIFSTR